MLLDQISFVSSLFHFFSSLEKKKKISLCVFWPNFLNAQRKTAALGLGLDQQVRHAPWAQTPADLGSSEAWWGLGDWCQPSGTPIPGPLGVWSDVGV